MTELADGQWELDGRQLMASRRDDSLTVHVQDMTRTKDVRAGDADNPIGDGVNFGRDYVGASTLSFTFAIRGRTAVETADAYDALEGAWRNEQVRRQPGATSVLRYRLNGRTRRVYGRGRKLDPVDKPGLIDGVLMPATGEFYCRDALTYDDVESGAHLGLVAESTTGTVLPVVLPQVLGVPAGVRRGVVNVAGSTSTPMRVVISGPVSGHLTSPVVKGHGWRVELPGLQVAYDEQVVIDTRDRTVEKNGVSVARYLSRKSDLTARLNTGSQEIVFTATDPTNTAAAQVFWRCAHYSL